MNSGLEAKYFKTHGKHKDNLSETDRRFSDSKETL